MPEVYEDIGSRPALVSYAVLPASDLLFEPPRIRKRVIHLKFVAKHLIQLITTIHVMIAAQVQGSG